MENDHTYASAIVTSQKVHKRKESDFYPTPPDVTRALLGFLNLERGTGVWEPACGDGAISKVLTDNGLCVFSSDLRLDSGFGKADVNFLEIPLDARCPDWIITNPPFALAEEFIRHALTFTPRVAMLLKSQYWHAKKRAALFEERPPSDILALTWRPAFLEAERGKSPLMDVVWVVWGADPACSERSNVRYHVVNRPES